MGHRVSIYPWRKILGCFLMKNFVFITQGFHIVKSIKSHHEWILRCYPNDLKCTVNFNRIMVSSLTFFSPFLDRLLSTPKKKHLKTTSQYIFDNLFQVGQLFFFTEDTRVVNRRANFEFLCPKPFQLTPNFTSFPRYYALTFFIFRWMKLKIFLK